MRSADSPASISLPALPALPASDVPFSPAWWCPGTHLQTLWARLARSRRLVAFEREVLATPDDDDLVLDHLPGPAESPRVLLLHGLEGSAYSLHTQGLAELVARAGWRATVLNFRSCARDPRRIRRRLRNRRPRLYHAGDTGDLELVVRTLVAREPATPLYAIGFSLGGNVLLRWLGEAGDGSAIAAAATISTPYDLAAASAFLARGVGRFYGARFMNRLRAKTIDVLARFPRETAHLDGARIRDLKTLSEFDEVVTAPLHGFPSAADYHARVSCIGWLARIAVPTLCISSTDDPFYPAAAVEQARAASSPDVMFEVTPTGGHTGFVAGPWPWRPRYWAEERSMAWLAREWLAREQPARQERARPTLPPPVPSPPSSGERVRERGTRGRVKGAFSSRDPSP